jgi:hypothetical protein
MWITKTFETKKQLDNWIARNKNKYRYEIIFINNGYGVEYKELYNIYL